MALFQWEGLHTVRNSPLLPQSRALWDEIKELEGDFEDLLSNLDNLEVTEDLIHGQEDEIIISAE